MKTKLILLILLIICFSCGTNNKPVSDVQKEKMKGEIKEVVNSIYKNSEEATFNNTIESYFDSIDYVCTYNGNLFGYNQAMAVNKSFFNSLTNQKCTILEEKYAILDNSTVVYTANTKWLTNFKDGHSVLQDPRAIQYIFKKTDNKWRIINVVLSGPEKIVKYKEPSTELNQIELSKQFIGSWKYDYSKDTTGFIDMKSYGAGIEGYFKNITKGKVIMEGKQLWGYDNKTDKIIQSHLVKGRDIKFYVYYFISENKFETIRYSDITNPEKASWKAIGEFKTPDHYEMTIIENNKPVKTRNFTRVKQ